MRRLSHVGIGEQQRTVRGVRRGERALDRSYQPFESGDREPADFKARLAELREQLETVQGQERPLPRRPHALASSERDR
jgi:hypothetical protein